MDWAKAAQMWAKRSGSTKPGTPRHGQSPRGVRPSPRPSPRQEGYGGGDSTPLFDERWSVEAWCTVQNRYLYIVLYLCEIMKWVKENSQPCFLWDRPYWRSESSGVISQLLWWLALWWWEVLCVGRSGTVTLTLRGAAYDLLCRPSLHVVVFLFVRADFHRVFFLNAELSTEARLVCSSYCITFIAFFFYNSEWKQISYVVKNKDIK